MSAPPPDQARDLVAVVLAAGAGTRLRPLTDLLPKPLCPVGNVPLIDHALRAIGELLPVSPHRVAVNINAHPDRMRAHLDGQVHLSHEQGEALGTAGALGALRNWIDGADVLVINGDTFAPAGYRRLLQARIPGTSTLLCAQTDGAADFGTLRYLGAAILSWEQVQHLQPTPTGLYEVLWREQHRRAELGYALTADQVVDCGSPADYLQANLLASGGRSVLGRGAVVHGTVDQCVLWPGAVVAEHEHLSRVIRVGTDLTVPAVSRAKIVS